MLDRRLVSSQLAHTLADVDLSFLGTKKIPGKVRDSYVVNGKRVLVTSDRLSAFDRILTTVPFKGQILNGMAAHWFELTKQIVPNHILGRPHANVFVATEVQIVPIEVVVRGYLAGSAWRDYEAGRPVSGITLPAGMRKSQKFERPLLTPSTKAEQGKHDEPIASDEIIERGLVGRDLWREIEERALELFHFGTEHARAHGLILVDTKYEFGTLRDENGKTRLILADEIHTPDSSRYWLSSSYEERVSRNEDPHMLDKEFVRRWLIERGYMGEGTPPEFTDDFRVDIALRYMEVYEQITGTPFHAEVGSPLQAIESALRSYRF